MKQKVLSQPVFPELALIPQQKRVTYSFPVYAHLYITVLLHITLANYFSSIICLFSALHFSMSYCISTTRTEILNQTKLSEQHLPSKFSQNPTNSIDTTLRYNRNNLMANRCFDSHLTGWKIHLLRLIGQNIHLLHLIGQKIPGDGYAQLQTEQSEEEESLHPQSAIFDQRFLCSAKTETEFTDFGKQSLSRFINVDHNSFTMSQGSPLHLYVHRQAAGTDTSCRCHISLHRFPLPT